MRNAVTVRNELGSSQVRPEGEPTLVEDGHARKAGAMIDPRKSLGICEFVTEMAAGVKKLPRKFCTLAHDRAVPKERAAGSDAQMGVDQIVGQRGDRAAGDAAPFLENAKLTGDAARER